MNLSVRQLGPDDQQAWRALRLDALTRHPGAFLTTAAEQQARSPEQDRQMLAQRGWYGLFGENALIGMASLIPHEKPATRHRCDIAGFYVASTAQGSGGAQILMTALVDAARARDARQLELMVAADNPRAIRFYERNGFRKFGTVPRAVISNGAHQDDFFYVRFLDDAPTPHSG